MLVTGILLLSVDCAARVPTRLVYSRTQATSDCPDEEALAAAVATRLGYEPFSPWGDQTIVATVSRRAEDLVGTVQLIDHDGIVQGSREVRTSHRECSELILALSLAISITLDPLHVESANASVAAAPARAAEPEAAEPKEPAQVPGPAEVAPAQVAQPARTVPPPPRHSASTPVTLHANAAVVGAYGIAPEFAVGGRLGLFARRSRWSLGAEGMLTAPVTQQESGGAEVRVNLVAATLAPCFEVVNWLSLCALGSLGSLHAAASGVTDSHSQSVLYASAGGRASFALSLGSAVGLFAGLDVTATLNRPIFMLDGREIWRPGPAAVLGGFGAAVRFF